MSAPIKAPLSHVCISREGVKPLRVEVSSFREAKSVVFQWVNSQPVNNELVHTSILLLWANGGYFNLGLLLTYPSSLDKINVLECTKYLIEFALSEATNPNWTTEENARRLQHEQQIGSTDHCRLIRETCMLDDPPLQ